MKFGKNLPRNEVPEWSSHYLNYKGLKKLINSAQAPSADSGSEDTPSPDLTAFFYELDRNVESVDDFFTKKSTDVQRRFKLLMDKYGDSRSDQLDFHELEDLVGALMDLRSQMQKLLWYADVNKRGFTKILKKLDKKLAVDKKSRYLSSKVDILSFADPKEISQSVQRVSLWLLKVSEDMNSLSVSPGIKRVSSAVRVGCPESDAVLFDKYIVADKSVQLATHIDSVNVDGRYDDVLVKLLQRAISLKSLQCIEVLLSRVRSLQEADDLYERNVLHKYIITFGRSQLKSTPSTPESVHVDEGFFITPAVNSRASSPNRLGRTSKPKERLDDIAILRILLERTPESLRSSLIARDFNGRIPLHYAALYGLYKACELVASYMRNWNLFSDPVRWDQAIWQDTDGLTPLHLAVMGSHKLTLKTLLDAEKRDPFSSSIRPVEGKSILILAVKEDSTEIVEQIIKAEMDINFQDSNGETALHHACRLGHIECASALVGGSELQKCNLEITENTFGWTPLFAAAVEGFTSIVDLLVEAGADFDKPDNSGWYAHEHAFFRGHLDCGRRIFPAESPPSSAFLSRTGTPDSLSKSPRPTKPDQRIETVKSFGHRYLVGKSMVVVTLGSTDVRKPISATPITLDTLPLTKAIPTHLDAALSLVVTAKGAEGEPYIFDLPFHDSQATEPLVFYTSNPEKVQLLFDIVPTYAGNREKIVGRAVALLSSVRTNVGRGRSSLQGGVTLPIVEGTSLNVIGTISFEFITITPFQHPHMAIGPNSTYWKSLITSRVIGHRGLGKNEQGRKSLQLGENTLASFIAAANLGASYVEMDVQLTKDNIPVLYHDFTVGETGIDAPMHSLTLEQFLAAKGSHQTHAQNNDTPPFVNSAVQSSTPTSNGATPRRSRSLNFADLPSDFQDRMRYTRSYKLKKEKGNTGSSIQGPFTTLEQVLKRVPVNVGFNIECKYPMIDECEQEEMDFVNVELNWWVDTRTPPSKDIRLMVVLKVVYDNLNGRDIIFSSFHPDICMMLALKQPNIPILFLTESGSCFMADIRASSLQQAIRFASRWNMLGIVSECSVFKCFRLVRVVKESGLVCVSYGKENDDKVFVRKQIEAGVDAVIVDSVLAIRNELTSGGLQNGIAKTKE